MLDSLDIAGYNYASGRYPKDGALHPSRVIMGSETFPQDIAKNWAMVMQYPAIVGDFMWTAWDYLGEAGIGAWTYRKDAASFSKPYPWLLANVGAVDILGKPTGEAFLAAAVWGKLAKPAIAVRPPNHCGKRLIKAVWRGTNAIPSWSWRGCEGTKAIVEVYTGAARVELQLDGKVIGEKRVKDYKATFKVVYRPGVLTAVSYTATGRETGRGELRSASGELRICVSPEQSAAAVGEIVYCDVAIMGDNGVVESNADTELTVTAECGDLLAFGSANPCTEERYDTGRFTTYYGRAQAVIRCGAAGVVKINVRGQGYAAAAEINVE